MPCRSSCLVQYRLRTGVFCAVRQRALQTHAHGHGNFKTRDQTLQNTKQGERHGVLQLKMWSTTLPEPALASRSNSNTIVSKTNEGRLPWHVARCNFCNTAPFQANKDDSESSLFTEHDHVTHAPRGAVCVMQTTSKRPRAGCALPSLPSANDRGMARAGQAPRER